MQKDDRILKKKLPNRNNCYCWLKALENREIACPGCPVASEPCDHLLAPTFAQLSGRHYINTNKAPAGATESKQGSEG